MVRQRPVAPSSAGGFLQICPFPWVLVLRTEARPGLVEGLDAPTLCGASSMSEPGFQVAVPFLVS